MSLRSRKRRKLKRKKAAQERFRKYFNDTCKRVYGDFEKAVPRMEVLGLRQKRGKRA